MKSNLLLIASALVITQTEAASLKDKLKDNTLAQVEAGTQAEAHSR